MIYMIISSFMLLMIMMIYLLTFLLFMKNNFLFIIEWQIYTLMNLKMNLYILIDDLSLVFLFVVTMITMMVIMYSIEYMEGIDMLKLKRFNYLILLFMLSMYMLILMPSMFSILIGWDLLGLSSYCLIIYYQNFKALNAGFLTIMLNRIGDCMLLMLISMNFINGSLNSNSNLIMNSLLIMIMAFTKSAQLPFSSWLPAAMMAPTPISSLVHSSTLVTAGVYLLVRYNKFIDCEIMELCLLISSLTMLFSGILANLENDFKKIIALSTLSQLGFMMSIMFMGMIDLTFLHLIIHALFKSLMFIAAGSMIHYLNSSQDLRDYVGIFYVYTFKSFIFLFSLMCLCGFPFMVGFYSKDLMIELILISNMNLISFMNLFLATILTISYSMRMLIIFLMYSNSKHLSLNIKNNKYMNMYMLMMMMMALFFSYFYLLIKYNYLMMMITLNLKLIILQMCLLGMFLGSLMNFYSSKFKYMLHFSKSMFFLNSVVKLIYMMIIKFIMKYDIYVEKFIMMMNKNLYINFMLIVYQKNISNFFCFIYMFKFFVLMLLIIY